MFYVSLTGKLLLLVVDATFSSIFHPNTKYQLMPLQQKASWRLTWFPTYYMKLYREEFDENVFELF